MNRPHTEHQQPYPPGKPVGLHYSRPHLIAGIEIVRPRILQPREREKALRAGYSWFVGSVVSDRPFARDQGTLTNKCSTKKPLRYWAEGLQDFVRIRACRSHRVSSLLR